jgi:Zn-dependent M32 family carboxypeptidase
LSTDGDRKKQERRYDKWIALHNASLDTARARKTLSQLRKELRAWEKTVETDQATRTDRKRKEKEGEEVVEKEYLVSRSSITYTTSLPGRRRIHGVRMCGTNEAFSTLHN